MDSLIKRRITRIDFYLIQTKTLTMFLFFRSDYEKLKNIVFLYHSPKINWTQFMHFLLIIILHLSKWIF